MLYVERGGKGLQVLVDEGDERLPARASRRSWRRVQRGRVRKLALERVDGEPIVGSAYEELLIELGFRAGPRKLTLTA